MKRRVCCLLLGLSILCLPVQQVYAAPAGPAAKTEDKKDEKLKPHEKAEAEKPKPHECDHEHEKPVPPHEKEQEHPLLPHEHVHEHEHPKPHEEKEGLLAEKPVPPAKAEKPVNTPAITPTPTATPQPTAIPTVVPTVTPQPTAVPTVAPKEEVAETPEASVLGSEVVKYALQFVGNPYKYGGTSLTNGTDCAGFTQAVYAHFGYSLARSSKGQAASTEFTEIEVDLAELLPGDLIFYANSSGVVYHVALYIGDGKVVHAANAKKGIVIADYSYYNMVPYKARRVIE